MYLPDLQGGTALSAFLLVNLPLLLKRPVRSLINIFEKKAGINQTKMELKATVVRAEYFVTLIIILMAISIAYYNLQYIPSKSYSDTFWEKFYELLEYIKRLGHQFYEKLYMKHPSPVS